MKSKTVEVHGTKYIIGHHPGEEALELGAKVSELLLPVGMKISMALDESDIGKPVSEMSETKQAVVSECMDKLLRSLKPKELLELAKELFAYTRLESEVRPLSDKIQFDTHFQGNLKPIVPLMKEIIEYNGFLDLNVLELVQ